MKIRRPSIAVFRGFVSCILVLLALAVWGDTNSFAKRGANEAVNSSPAPDENYTLKGHIYFANGLPAANATVTMTGSSTGSTTSGADGSFQFTLPPINCFVGSHAVVFNGSLTDPSCPSHLRRDSCPFFLCSFFIGCGGGGEYNAGQINLGGCTGVVGPGPTPTPDPGEDKVVKPFPWEVPTGSDTNFVSEVPPGAFSVTKFRADGPILVPLPVKRVIGTLNGDGTLYHPQELIDNGIVTGEAILSIPAYDVDYSQGERDHVFFNGVEVGPEGAAGFLQGSDKTWTVSRFRIPIDLIHFGNRNPGHPPDPGQNEVKIMIDQANTGGAQRWAVSVGPPALQFDALAPVVMVHGNGSCGAFFAGNWGCNDRPRPPQEEWFTHPFDVQRIPYDNSINMPTDTVATHAYWLRRGDGGNIRSIKDIAEEFGAKHVNLIAHSKGGIDVRAWLTLLNSGNTPGGIGVHSFTTLSSPHLGSVGADYQDSVSRVSKAGLANSDSLFRATMAQLTGTDKGKFDLRVDSMEGFNRTNIPALPRLFTIDNEVNHMQYFAISADANVDNSQEPGSQVVYGHPELFLPTITDENTGPPNEVRGIPYIPRLENYTHRGHGWTLQQVYRMFGNVNQAVVRPKAVPGTFGQIMVKSVIEIPETGFFQANDFAVTVNSARPMDIGIPFLATSHRLANHAVLSSAPTANIAIGWIRQSHVLRLPEE